MTPPDTRLLGAATIASVMALAGCGQQPTDSGTTSSATRSATSTADPAATSGEELVGEWTMTALEPGGDVDGTVPFDGQVIFTHAGTMAVQAANPDPQAPDTAYTVAGYEAYYGPVTIESNTGDTGDTGDTGTFTLEVASAAARDLVGQQLTRAYEVTDDTLVLTPTDPAETWRVTYERQQR